MDDGVDAARRLALYEPEDEPEASCLLLRVWGYGFRVQGLGYIRFRVLGSGFRVSGSGFRIHGLGFRVHGLGFRVHGLGVQGLGFNVPSGFLYKSIIRYVE